MKIQYLSSTIRMYEDLTVTNDNDKYQYIFPEFSFSKDIELDKNYDGNFNFSSIGYQKIIIQMFMKLK